MKNFNDLSSKEKQEVRQAQSELQMQLREAGIPGYIHRPIFARYQEEIIKGIKEEKEQEMAESIKEKMKNAPQNMLEELKALGCDRHSSALAHSELMKENEGSLLANVEKDWTPLRITQEEIIENQVFSTSERVVYADDKNKSDHLTNIYVKVNENGYITIRCGVINTNTKAKEFMQAVKWALEKRGRPDLPLRISMHQLNSMGVFGLEEGKLVKSQKEQVNYINSNIKTFALEGLCKLDEGPVIVHGNICIDGFTKLIGEDKQSKKLNREGLVVQMLWLAEDIANDSKNLLEKDENFKFLYNIYVQQMEAVKSIKNLSDLNEIDDLEISLIKKVAQSLAMISEYAGNQKENTDSFSKIQLKTFLGAQVLASQLDQQIIYKSVLDRKLAEIGIIDEPETPLPDLLVSSHLTNAQQVGMQILLDYVLGAISETNCKSGLDRTGFVSAFAESIRDQIKTGKPIKEIAHFILHFEENIKLLDKASSNIEKAFKDYRNEQKKDVSFDDWISGNLDKTTSSSMPIKTNFKSDNVLERFIRDEFQNINQEELNSKIKTFRDVFQFQSQLLYHLRKTALPITQNSTGLRGMKLHQPKNWKDFKEIISKNMHPLPYLPMFDRDGTRLIEVNRVTGKRSMSKILREELSGAAKYRGS